MSDQLNQSNLIKEPKSLSDIRFHDHLISRIKRFIESEKYPAALFFSGPPGTGKTATVKNLIRTVRCLNRPVGSSKSCGECRVCKSDPSLADPVSNIMWIQQGKAQNIGDQIKEITDFVFSPPELSGLQGSKEHTNRKFVVIDELQNLSDQHISRLLYLSEVPKLEENKVMLIFITMNEERLNETTLNALVSRSKRFYYKAPDYEQITEFLVDSFGDTYPSESLEMISWESNCNLRKALTLMDCCLEDNNSLNPIAVAETLNFVNLEKRIDLWRLIMAFDYSGRKLFFEIDNYVQSILRQGAIEHNLLRQLVEDVKYCLIEECEAEVDDQLETLKRLTDYMSDSCPVPISTFLILLAKEKLNPVDINLLKQKHEIKSGYDRIKERSG